MPRQRKKTTTVSVEQQMLGQLKTQNCEGLIFTEPVELLKTILLKLFEVATPQELNQFNQ